MQQVKRKNKEVCDITSSSKGEYIKIYINEIIHLSLIQEGLQIHSYKKQKDWYCIEFLTIKGLIIADYNNIEKWKSILKIIDELLI